MNTRLVTKTTGVIDTEYENKSIDEIIVGIARLSSSRSVNELFDEPSKLLRHCVLNQHWSIMEQANLTFEIETSRAMGREILRHKSISPQEFSQRYAIATNFEDIELRVQSKNNRQSSTDAFDPEVILEDSKGKQYKDQASNWINMVLNQTNRLYNELLKNDVARECARLILPETTTTVMYMNGNIRSWISFLNQRLHKTAQKEIRLIAEQIRDVLIKECPIISAAFFNFEDAYDIHVMERIVLEKYGVYNTIKSNGFKKVDYNKPISDGERLFEWAEKYWDLDKIFKRELNDEEVMLFGETHNYEDFKRAFIGGINQSIKNHLNPQNNQITQNGQL